VLVTVGQEAESARDEIAELRTALAREERIASALREVGNALGTTLDLDDLLELILGRLTDLLEADRCTLYLLDQAKAELVSRIVIGEQVRSIRVRVGHGIAGTVAKTGKAIRLKDAYTDTRFEPEWDLFTGYRTKSMLAAPLKNHMGRTIGVIQVLNKTTGEEFTAEDEAILSALSTQAAVAIDNSRLFLSLIQKNHQLLSTKEKLERRVADLQLLNELERAMARAESLEDLARAALSALARACQAQGATLLLGEEDTGDLFQYVYDSDRPDGLDRFGVKAG
jgi:GAF domain-containing protein